MPKRAGWIPLELISAVITGVVSAQSLIWSLGARTRGIWGDSADLLLLRRYKELTPGTVALIACITAVVAGGTLVALRKFHPWSRILSVAWPLVAGYSFWYATTVPEPKQLRHLDAAISGAYVPWFLLALGLEVISLGIVAVFRASVALHNGVLRAWLPAGAVLCFVLGSFLAIRGLDWYYDP